MATERGTPARSRFRTAVRRKSWGIPIGLPRPRARPRPRASGLRSRPRSRRGPAATAPRRVTSAPGSRGADCPPRARSRQTPASGSESPAHAPPVLLAVLHEVKQPARAKIEIPRRPRAEPRATVMLPAHAAPSLARCAIDVPRAKLKARAVAQVDEPRHRGIERLALADSRRVDARVLELDHAAIGCLDAGGRQEAFPGAMPFAFRFRGSQSFAT